MCTEEGFAEYDSKKNMNRRIKELKDSGYKILDSGFDPFWETWSVTWAKEEPKMTYTDSVFL